MQMIPMTSCAQRLLSPEFCIGSCVWIAFTATPPGKS
jgi:hypothetical protein